MGADVEAFDPGGDGPKGTGEIFQGGSTGGVGFQGRDVGHELPDRAGPDNLPEQGRAKAHREAAKEAGEGGSWYYTLLVTEMTEAGFKAIGVYITRRQNTVRQDIETRPILDLCERSIWRPGAWVYRRWWEQKSLDLERGKYRA